MYSLGRLCCLVVLLSVAVAGYSSQPLALSAVSASGFTRASAGETAAQSSVAGGRPASPGVVFVTSQQLYYDTFVTVDPLPMRGRFQPIGDSDGDGIAETPYGPGDPGYLGGRWWEDVNGDGVQDAGDHYFLCPLLGPGRETP